MSHTVRNDEYRDAYAKESRYARRWTARANRHSARLALRADRRHSDGSPWENIPRARKTSGWLTH